MLFIPDGTSDGVLIAVGFNLLRYWERFNDVRHADGGRHLALYQWLLGNETLKQVQGDYRPPVPLLRTLVFIQN